MKRHAHNEFRVLRGQSLTEYLILTALIAIGSVGIVRILGHNIQSRLAVISDQIIGVKNDSKGRSSKREDYRMRGLDDFQSTGR
jgi:hypothetical protein